MDSNMYMVPITNLVIESVFKLGDVYFSPPYTQAENCDLSFTDSITQAEFEKIQGYIELFNKSNQIVMTNTTMAIMNYENLSYQNIEGASIVIDRVCEKVDRTLDYLRLAYCQMGNFDTLPGLPGFVSDGFKTVYTWDNNTNRFNIVPGEVTLMIQKGIGLMPSNEPSRRDLDKIDWKCVFSERTDEVFLNCRTALTRINEAMYMTNLNAAFIYLMTTIEMLADKDTMLRFDKTKTKILPFIARDKTHYFELSEYIKYLSQSKRTEIVHNGKNIYELYTDKSQVLKELFKVTCLITRYVKVVVALEIHTYDELEHKRNELQRDLKV
ncbi:hypothetical protein QYM23_11190 [Bacillus cereus]|uniref:Apea-like HEPN domain-containing protein n=1 Tax=Bacillus cereus TaxID=1396 RepID=A0AAW7NEH3_BACCE|nr:hypothetical protein [Bacillus cereus]MCJ0846286.1 hypothetical protein [Bacillus cereus]MDA2046929.1 hypothetical protein [Bacillus cereus]MDN4873420.1 hypothetical protein [Bacillus cereus]